jgi:hypothetical protein
LRFITVPSEFKAEAENLLPVQPLSFVAEEAEIK